MSQWNEGPKTFTAGADLEANRRVKLSASSGTQVEYAGLDEQGIGTTLETVTSESHVGVWLDNLGGTRKVVASEVISANTAVYAGADGKLDAAGGGAPVQIGTALEAATADGDIIEVLLV